jgi:hypothetical protein
LEADVNMPTACKKSMTPKKAGSKTDDVITLSRQLGKLNVCKVKYVSLDWRFPMSMYSVMEGDCNMIYIELMKGVQLPPEYIVHAKVLPGGMQFSLLVGVPCYVLLRGELHAGSYGYKLQHWISSFSGFQPHRHPADPQALPINF